MDELRPTAVIAMTGIRILPGTGMVEIALRDGQIDADDNLALDPQLLRLAGARRRADRPHRRVRARSSRTGSCPGSGIKTNIAVLRSLRERKIKGQLWRLLR